MELDHHGAVHLTTISSHVIDTLHAYEVLTSALYLHQILVTNILILLSTIVEVLVN